VTECVAVGSFVSDPANDKWCQCHCPSCSSRKCECRTKQICECV
jgi:hypothetical protein